MTETMACMHAELEKCNVSSPRDYSFEEVGGLYNATCRSTYNVMYYVKEFTDRCIQWINISSRSHCYYILLTPRLCFLSIRVYLLFCSCGDSSWQRNMYHLETPWKHTFRTRTHPPASSSSIALLILTQIMNRCWLIVPMCRRDIVWQIINVPYMDTKFRKQWYLNAKKNRKLKNCLLAVFC